LKTYNFLAAITENREIVLCTVRRETELRTTASVRFRTQKEKHYDRRYDKVIIETKHFRVKFSPNLLLITPAIELHYRQRFSV